MNDPFTPPAPRRWPWLLLALAGGVWAICIALAVADVLGAPLAPEPIDKMLLGIGILAAPLAVILLAVVQLRDAGAVAALRAEAAETRAQQAATTVERSAETLARLEAGATAVAERLAGLAGPIAALDQQLRAALQALDTSATRAEEAGARLASAVPAATAQADALTELLNRSDDQVRRQLAETETLLAALYTRAAEAEAQARTAATASASAIDAVSAAAAQGHDRITAAAAAAQAAVAVPTAALETAVDMAFTRTARVMDSTREAVHVQTSAMLAGLDQARVTLGHIGEEAAGVLETRLKALLALANQTADIIAGAGGRAQALVSGLGSDVAGLSERLNAGLAEQADALARLDAGMAGAGAQADALAAPLAAARERLAGIETQLAALAANAGETVALLSTRLPDQQPQLAALAAQLADVRAAADALAEPIAAGSNIATRTIDDLAAARDALATSSADLSDAIARARDEVAGLSDETGRLGLSVSGELIDTFGRVRDIAQAAAGAMRTTLAGVVTEAEQALDQAAIDRAETAFAGPIRERIAELELAQARAADAGQAAAERVAQRLLGLSRTLTEVEAHVDAVETRADVRARNALGRRANGLIDALQASAVDIARLLDFDIDDRAWNDYAAGDRSAIARRLASGLDHGVGRQFARHYSHDPAFRSEATRFLNEFEALIADIVPDRGGDALGATLLSSTLGKLYMAIGQVAGRFN
jgi:predicted  nucleic acid-binding Zn-ribbon protein